MSLDQPLEGRHKIPGTGVDWLLLSDTPGDQTNDEGAERNRHGGKQRRCRCGDQVEQEKKQGCDQKADRSKSQDDDQSRQATRSMIKWSRSVLDIFDVLDEG